MLVSDFDRASGPWTGFDDANGTGVLRARVAKGQGRSSWHVSVAPDPRYHAFVGRLVVLWGGLQILHRIQPWLAVTASAVSEESAQRGLDGLASSAF